MSESVVDTAYAFLRSHTRADLRFDENMRPIKYVIAPDGRLVAPAMVAMIRSVDTVLFIPEYAEGAMEVQVTLLELDEHGPDGALTDRWRIYHGEPEDVRWAFISIDMARFGEMVIDGLALMRSNPLVKDEARLCKMVNQTPPEQLRQFVARYGPMEVESPRVVGIDSLGLDVRARFDVVRVSATQPMQTAEDAERVVRRMLSEAPNSTGMRGD